MSSVKKRGFSRLRVELLFAALVSLIVAYGCHLLVKEGGSYYLDGLIASEDYMYGKNEKMSRLFQEYVDDKGLLLEDTGEILHWCRENKTSVTLYNVKTQGLYSYYSFLGSQAQISTVDEMAFEVTSEYATGEFAIRFADDTNVRALFYYDRIYNFYNYFYTGSLFAAGISFLLVFTMLIATKINYIRIMDKELKILEGGDLEYEVTELGSDELYQLARGINEMRKAVLRREEEERRNAQANQELVTALSHDIRTPMTSLIGYLEILKMGRYHSEEQKEEFLEISRQKAFQMKEMTDKLFEYSLVTGKMEETYHLERMEVGTILSAILDGQVSDLVNDGWEVEENLSSFTSEGYVMADVEFFQRVLDNLLSNIRKYADKSGKVIVGVKEGEEGFTFSIRNRVLHEEALGGSTGVGLKTCQKIMEAMNGSFRVERTKNIYCVSVTLPLIWPQGKGRQTQPGQNRM